MSSRASGHRGFALPAVLVILVALALVGSAAAVLTSTDVRVANLYNLSNRASAAATGALEHASAHFVANGPADGWPVTGAVSGYDYTVSITRDSFDFGDGVQPVSWSAAAGYNGDDQGAAVWLLAASADRGPYRAEQRLRIVGSSATYSVQPAAVVSNSTVRARGNAEIDGEDESDGDCGDGPAVVLTDPGATVDASGNVDIDGGDEYEDNDPPYVVTDTSVQPTSPEDVLGLPAGALDAYQQTGLEFDLNHTGPLAGIVYVTDDFGSAGAGSSNIDGSGILIVHNPLYDPREHDPSHALYDPLKANNPLYGPATLGNITGGEFEGLIIADRVDRLAGNVEIIGAIVSLSLVDRFEIRGNAEISFSCEAIQTVIESETAGLGGVRRLSWTAP